MSNIQVVDWVTRREAINLTKIRSILTLSAFSVADITWDGVSKIVKQYNYSADNAFYLTEVPERPSSVNFGLAIRYRVGDLVTRYKLWDVDGVDYQAPAYNGEIILANFVIEVWNQENETDATLDEDVVFITSTRTMPTDLRSMDDVELAEATEVDYAELIITPDGPVLHYSLVAKWLADDLVSGSIVNSSNPWTDRVNGRTFTNVGSPITQPTVGQSGLLIGGKNYITFTDGLALLCNSFSSIDNAGPAYIYLMVQQTGPWVLNHNIIKLDTNGNEFTKLRQGATTPGIRLDADDGNVTSQDNNLTIGNFKIVRVSLDSTMTILSLKVEDNDEVSVSAGWANWFNDFYLGDLSVGAAFRVAGILYFQGATLTSQNEDDVRMWLNSYYGVETAFSLPLIQSANGYWLSND